MAISTRGKIAGINFLDLFELMENGMATGLKSSEVTLSVMSSSLLFVTTSLARRLRFLDGILLSSCWAWSDQIDDDLVRRTVCLHL